MKYICSYSTLVLWTQEPFDAIRRAVESALELHVATRSTGNLVWHSNSVLATIEPNCSAAGCQRWMEDFTATSERFGVDFLCLAFDPNDRSRLSTPSKNHVFASAMSYLNNEIIVHDIPIEPNLRSKCVHALVSTTWPTPDCMRLYKSGPLWRRESHAAYITSKEAYLEMGLLPPGDRGYLARSSGAQDQTLHDVLTGMERIAIQKGWSVGRL
jgi:hypothetical protein